MGKYDEVWDRGRQALGKRVDLLLYWLGYGFAQDICRLEPTPEGNFFFRPESVDSILGLLSERLPESADQIIREAEEIRRHQFRLLGYSILDYGDPIDWHWDAVHGKRAPKRQFYRLRYLDFAECGDAKVIWELNRHRHFVTLAKAYRLSGDREYFNELLRQKNHWHSENPYPIGINWASSLEVAFRTLSWIWALHMLSGAPDLPKLRIEWRTELALHGRHLERYLSTYFSPNTHLLGEALALFFLGVLFPELVAAKRWKRLGWEVLLRESQRQVRADGFYFEQSTHYHVYALDFLLHAAVLASLNSIPVPQHFCETIAKMLDALFLLSRQGPPPQFGDDDGGRLFDPGRNRSEHMLDPLSTGAVLFKRGDFKRLLPNLTEETLWILGEEGVRQWDSLAESEISSQSSALSNAGYYLLGTPTTQLIVDAGPLGFGRSGHGHADALSICLQAHGRPLLIDPGTAEYVGAGADRNSFRGTRMHNSVQIDGRDQADIGSTFSWRTFPQTTVEHWVNAPSCDLLAAGHDGYCRLQDAVTHRRWIVSLKDGAYLVRDLVSGVGRHRIEIAWHLPPDVRLAGEHTFVVNNASCSLTFVPSRSSGWAEELNTRMCSPAYGRKVQMPVLRFYADATLPSEFAILLVTGEERLRMSESCLQFENGDCQVSAYEYRSAELHYSFIFNESGKPWQHKTLESDAKYVCYKRSPKAGNATLFFCCGSFARIGDLDLSCSARVEWAELSLRDDVQTVASSDQSTLLIPTTLALRSGQTVSQTGR